MASVGLFLQCLTSVVCSILMERWMVLLGARAVYVSSVILLALATAVMSFSTSVVMVTVMAAATGYTFCVLQVLPYTLLCLYHSDRQVRQITTTCSDREVIPVDKPNPTLFSLSLSLLHLSVFTPIPLSPSLSQVFFSSSKSRPSHPGDSDDHIHSKPLLPPDSVHGNRYPEGVNLPGAPILSSSTSPHVSLPLEREGEPIPLPQRGMCLDMAILDSAYLLSQVNTKARL